MKTIGIITIHKIYNYGSIFQAFALQTVCNSLGYKTSIIDYIFPNAYHERTESPNNIATGQNEPKVIKALFIPALIRQHRAIQRFIKNYLSLSDKEYNSPQELHDTPPKFDIYLTGSDQLWSPTHCKGDPSFMLHFAPDSAKKISYAASIGTDVIPDYLKNRYKKLLSRYSAISVREESACRPIEKLINLKPKVVLDPTLLLDKNYWNSLAVPQRIIKDKYILCYFLNYSFDAFPYADIIAKEVQRQTGYKIIKVARPPHKLTFNNIRYNIGASPEEFLALVRDAEIILTTSFHGTAFAINFGRPVFSIVKSKNNSDNRQSNLLMKLNLEKNIIPVSAPLHSVTDAIYDNKIVESKLSSLREQSISFLKEALADI